MRQRPLSPWDLLPFFWKKIRRHGFAVLSVLVLATLALDSILPTIGPIYIPSRRTRQPRLPYGLSLVDTDADLRFAVSTDADIVFVHGLGAFPDSTWQKRTKTGTFQGTSQSEVSWIRDLLPEDVPNARLLFFNYDSTFWSDAPQKNLEDIAQELLYAFQVSHLRATPAESVRPIIFLCHSYGGLVVKEALVQAAAKHDDNRDIADNAKGFIFLGTPHRGTEYSEWARQAALRLNRLHSNPDIFLPLEVDSPSLRQLHEGFMSLYGDTKVFNFYETRPTQVLRVPCWRWPYSVMLVNQTSATFEAPNATSIPLDTDHSGLNKYNSRDDIGYESVQGSLWFMVKRLYEESRALRVNYHHAENASQQDPDSACPPQQWHLVPLQTVRSYTDRPTLMAQISTGLNNFFDDRDPPRSVALWGLNGMGKTQLALRYAEESKDLYNIVIWIDAQSQATALNSFEAAYEALGLEYPMHVLDQLRKGKVPFSQPISSLRGNWLVAEVLNHLEHRPRTLCRWLIIIDNADNLEFLHDIMPRGRSGTVLITSNDQYISRFTNYAIHVDKLTTSESINLLTRSAQLEIGDLDATNGTSRWRQHKMQEALAIVNELDHTAIAIDAAGNYIAQHDHVREDLALYIDYLDENSNRLLLRPRPNVEDRYKLTIATVWETSFNAVNETDRESAALLTILGQLNGIQIEDRLFIEASQFLQDSIGSGWKTLVLGLQGIAYFGLPILSVRLILSFLTWNERLHHSTRYKMARWIALTPILIDIIGVTVVYCIQVENVRQGNTVPYLMSWVPDVEDSIILTWLGFSYSISAVVDWIMPENSNIWLSNFPFTYTVIVGIVCLLERLRTGLDERISRDAGELLDQLDFSRSSMTRFMKVIAAIHKISSNSPGWNFIFDIAWILFWGFLLKIIVFAIIEIAWILWTLTLTKLCDMIQDRGPPATPRWRMLFAILRIAQSRTAFFGFCFLSGYIAGSTGLFEWIPWRHNDRQKVEISTKLIDSLVQPRRMGTWDPKPYSETMAPLTRFGILHRTPQSGYSMHSLVQWWIRHRIPSPQEKGWAREALRFITMALHSKTCWLDTTCQRALVSHLVELANTEVLLDDTKLGVLRTLLKMLYRCLRKVDAAYGERYRST